MSTVVSIEQMEGLYRQKKIECLDEKTMSTALSKFDYYQKQGVIIQGEFESNVWRLYDQTKTALVHFDVNELLYKRNMSLWIGCNYRTYCTCIKSYILLCMGNYSLAMLSQIANYLRLLPDKMPESIANSNEALHVLQFLEILPGESLVKDTILEELRENMTEYTLSSKQRKLPSFRSYFQFHDVLMKFWQTESITQKKKYFPVYLWWQITAILPLRATEFLLIPRKCITKTKQGNLLTIRRTLMKKKRKEITYRIDSDYEERQYSVPDSIADDILWYLKQTEGAILSELDTLIVPAGLNKLGFFSYSQMAKLLRDFCACYLQSADYPIHLGDTRHLAMINLILSGGSPVICKELAGHESIDISSHYYSNMSSLVEDVVYERFRRQQSDSHLDGFPTFKISIPTERVRVEGGYCEVADLELGNIDECIKSMDSEGIPGDCMNCIHYYPDLKRMQLSIKNHRKETLNMDSEFLRDMIEQVRKGYGCEEDIRTAMLKLQGSAVRYSAACLWDGDRYRTTTQEQQ